jgi:hypothetical protein
MPLPGGGSGRGMGLVSDKPRVARDRRQRRWKREDHAYVRHDKSFSDWKVRICTHWKVFRCAFLATALVVVGDKGRFMSTAETLWFFNLVLSRFTSPSSPSAISRAVVPVPCISRHELCKSGSWSRVGQCRVVQISVDVAASLNDFSLDVRFSSWIFVQNRVHVVGFNLIQN